MFVILNDSKKHRLERFQVVSRVKSTKSVFKRLESNIYTALTINKCLDIFIYSNKFLKKNAFRK